MKAQNTVARPQATKQSLTMKVESKPVVYKDINGDEVSMSLSLLNNVLAYNAEDAKTLHETRNI